MKAILIDPHTRQITEIDGDFNDYKAINAALGCDLMTVATYINDANDCILVDDEGLFKERQPFFLWDAYPQPLAGRGIILGTDDEGDTVSPQVTVEYVASHVTWLSAPDAVTRYNDNLVAARADAAIRNAMGVGGFVIVSAPDLELDKDGFAVIR